MTDKLELPEKSNNYSRSVTMKKLSFFRSKFDNQEERREREVRETMNKRDQEKE